VEIRGTLGEGGMGIVRLGRQRALDRAVAVKTLKSDHRDARSTARLLREAWVTGYLDHPNVVPVYDIVADGDGVPLIVLKKIEGVAWSELIHDGEAVRTRFGAEDLLEWNLAIALQVANAIGFAHSRGVLHRDIKPENVMIGSFGEVYVVDWGLAVKLEDDGTGRLPTAASANVLAGTPHYMAPEMLGSGPPPTERTDVYLLGAVLYEIATGHPPHRGETLMQIVASIARSTPEIPENVPRVLAATIRQAMQRHMSDRHASVEELTRSLRAVQRSRDAERITRRGEALFEQLCEVAGAPAETDEATRTQRARSLYIECRASFQNALELWPEHEAAREGMAQLVRTMVDHEIRRGDPEAAHALLADLPTRPEDLVERIDAARHAKKREAERLADLARDHDPARGKRTRFMLAVVVGCVWVVTPMVINSLILAGAMELEPGWEGLGIPLALLAIVIGFGYWARESMTATKMNRLISTTALVAMVSNVIGSAVGIALDRPPEEHIHTQLLMFGGIAAVGAVGAEPWIWVVSASYLAGYVVVPFIGLDYTLYVLGIANISILVVAFARWRPS
jgi:serine/threonine-protein kinase